MSSKLLLSAAGSGRTCGPETVVLGVTITCCASDDDMASRYSCW